jgi:hypothetical protein
LSHAEIPLQGVITLWLHFTQPQRKHDSWQFQQNNEDFRKTEQNATSIVSKASCHKIKGMVPLAQKLALCTLYEFHINLF